jgi:hypothetical protein
LVSNGKYPEVSDFAKAHTRDFPGRCLTSSD